MYTANIISAEENDERRARHIVMLSKVIHRSNSRQHTPNQIAYTTKQRIANQDDALRWNHVKAVVNQHKTTEFKTT